MGSDTQASRDRAPEIAAAVAAIFAAASLLVSFYVERDRTPNFWFVAGITFSFGVLALILASMRLMRSARPERALWLLAPLSVLSLFQASVFWHRGMSDFLPHYARWAVLGNGKALALITATALAVRRFGLGGGTSRAPAQPEGSETIAAFFVGARGSVMIGAIAWLIVGGGFAGAMPGGGRVAWLLILPPLALAARFIAADRLLPSDARFASAVGVLSYFWCALILLMPVPYAPLGFYLLLSPWGWLFAVVAVGGSHAFRRAGRLVRETIAAPASGGSSS